MNKPILMSEEQLLKEINALYKEYKRIIFNLNSHYYLLSKLREQFPLRFLGSDTIKDFLEKTNELNSQEIKKLEKEVDKINKTISAKKTKEGTTLEADSLDDKIKDLQLELNIKKNYINYFNKMIKSIDKNSVNYFYEDLLLFASNCKHEAIDLWKNSYAIHGDLEINEEYFKGQFLVEVSEDALKDKGFNKISADIRKAYLDSRKELKLFKQLRSKALTLKETSRELLNCFTADEVNLRRFVERYNKIHGL